MVQRPPPTLLAILNVTPDSFSGDGDLTAGIERGHALLAAGADMLDIGGESTRPGADPVAPAEEQARILPVIEALAAAGARLSVDTRNAETAARALDAGAILVNDVSGLRHDPGMAPLVAARGCPVVIMHSRGTPQTMRSLARYDDVVTDVRTELRDRIEAALGAGIAQDAIILDPGFGFAKTPAHSIALLRGLDDIVALGFPVLAGVSRKSFIGRLTGEDDASHRDPGSIAAALFALSKGASWLRVHDAAGMRQALRVWDALSGNSALFDARTRAAQSPAAG